MGKTTSREVKYEEVEMNDLVGNDDAEYGNDDTEDGIVWMSDNFNDDSGNAPPLQRKLSCFQIVLLFFILVSVAAIIGRFHDFGEVLDLASSSTFMTKAPTTFPQTMAPTSETSIFATTSTNWAKSTPSPTATKNDDGDKISPPTHSPTKTYDPTYSPTHPSEEPKVKSTPSPTATKNDDGDKTSPPTHSPTKTYDPTYYPTHPSEDPKAKSTPSPTATENDDGDKTSTPTYYPSPPLTIEDHTTTIVDGIDDSEIYCEDLSIYEEWHNKKVTRKDGIMYRVVEQMDHDETSFTQGLTYARGKLFESAGLYRKSSVRILDPDTADVELQVPMGASYFAEGMAYYKDTLVQITWKSQQGFIYNLTNLEQIDTFEFETTKNEGWGITWDRCNDELIVTDGSPNLHFWDPETLKEIRRVEVTRIDGTPAKNMNEIEFWRGRVLANVWFQDVVLVINPETGKVEKEYDFSQLWPKHDRSVAQADVLNGISISDTPDTLYFTGKLWDRIFRVQLLPDL